MNNQTPTYYDKYSVAERYGVGITKAGDIIRAIRLTCGGGALPVGKVLPAELIYWEQKYSRPVREFEEYRAAPPVCAEPHCGTEQ